MKVLIHSIALMAFVGAACSSSSDDSAGLDSPGDACDGSSPIICGSLSEGGTSRNVVLFCKNGTYETAMDCKPSGNGLTNRCFGGGNGTVTDCFDEPSQGKVTRCEVSGSGASLTYACTVGTR